VSVRQLHQEVAAGRRSRHGFLEEIERFLESDTDAPLEGALEILLEELRQHPGDAHLIRLVALLRERAGSAADVRRSFATTGEAPASSLDLRLLHARVLLHLGQSEEAEEIARRVLAEEHNNLSALGLLAKICHIDGRLTEMIKLWQRIHVLAPNREGALAQLGHLHHLARDDDLVRTRFVAVGLNTYARKQPAQIELEKAFARFRNRDFNGALAICDELAAANRGKRPELYKLAILQTAWFQERTGELETARATLQQLGRERGFETDLDRLVLLARICEEIGTPQAREQAIYIQEHLHLRYGKLSALPRLSVLCAASGDHVRSAAYRRSFERRFARRMQRPTAAEIVRALAAHYLPLAELPAIAIDEEQRASLARETRLTPVLAERQRLRALVAHLTGDVPRARRYWRRLVRSRSAASRDYGYLADTYADEGRWTEAQSLYGEALRRAPSDKGLWRQALRAPRPQSHLIGQMLTDPGFLHPVREALRGSARIHHADPHAWERLATLESWAGLAQDAAAHRAKAKALRAALRDSADIGRVLVAAVYSLDGKCKGIVHEILASRHPGPDGGGIKPDGGIHGYATADLVALIHSTLATTKQFARSHWPHLCSDADRFFYSLGIAKEDEPSSGTSAGLPVAIAFLSVLLQKPVPQDIALSGALVCDSHAQVAIHRVGDAPHKLRGAYHRDLAAVVLPEENRSDVESGDIVPASVAGSMVRYAASLSEAIEATWGPVAWDW
jgi:tetratricopeptide (TPR) repeat protein